jgi:hypothetical protein
MVSVWNAYGNCPELARASYPQAMRAEIIAIERTFPELALPGRKQT